MYINYTDPAIIACISKQRMSQYKVIVDHIELKWQNKQIQINPEWQYPRILLSMLFRCAMFLLSQELQVIISLVV